MRWNRSLAGLGRSLLELLNWVGKPFGRLASLRPSSGL